MASGSGERTQSDKEQEEHLPQITPDKGKSKKRMRGTGKSSKPPEASKKKAEEKPEEVAQPEAGTLSDDVAATEDLAATEDQDISFEDRPRKGGRGHEPNTTAEMSDLTGYGTPPHGETLTEGNSRIQRICQHWAKKWYNYENVCDKYTLLFAFTPPWGDCIDEGCIKEGGHKVRPAHPPNPHTNSIKTPADYPQEVDKRAKAKAKRDKKAAKTEKVEAENVVLTQQDAQKKKDRASASQEGRQRENPSASSSAAKPQKKTLAKRAKKAANASEDEG